MSALKTELGLKQVTKDADFPALAQVRDRKEGGAVAGRNGDDEMIALLREIRDQRQGGSRWQDGLKLAITVILCVITLASAFAIVVGNNTKMEFKLQQAETENLKLWQRLESQQLEIADINKRDAVRKALEDAKKGK